MELTQFISAFDTEEKCVAHLAAIRWPNGPVCDKCGSVNNAGKSRRPRYWHCHNCRQMFSVTAGTPMEETRLPLPKWFAAIFLIVTSSKGVSSMAIKRQIGVGYKTAWFLTHRIRAMLDTDDALLRGVVEVDETYIGGKRRKGRKSKRDDEGDQPCPQGTPQGVKGRAGTRKMMAVTAVERGGRAKARKGRTHSERTIARTIYDWAGDALRRPLRARNSTLVTDELPAYRWIGRKFRAHLRVNHSAGEWARLDPHGRGLIHTNTVESFNATIKRAIIGVWHWFSIKHGDRYLNELAARWCPQGTRARSGRVNPPSGNWRGMDNMARFDIALRGLFEPALLWKALTA